MAAEELKRAMEENNVMDKKGMKSKGLPTIYNVEGQLHEGIAMGLGYALTEEFINTKTDRFAKFKVPRAEDMPEKEAIALDIPRVKGTFGASGTAEYAHNPIAPAIVNGICDACGLCIRDLPIIPEKIRQALQS
jgi:CO/xanthine dehydrogenase Mo-binding subunit